MSTRISISADLGEGFGRYRVSDDEAMLDIVTAANIACGFHAGDPRIMHAAVRNCIEKGVAIGAHPGFKDLLGFGRRTIDLTPHEVYTDTLYQLGALSGVVRAQGGKISHLTPHGKLGNLSRKRDDYAEAIATAVSDFDPAIRVVSREGLLTAKSKRLGLRTGYSGFADRAYGDDGELVARSVDGAVIVDPETTVQRVLRMVQHGTVETITGNEISVRCDSIVVHGDTPGAVDLARLIKLGLKDAGVDVISLDAA